MSRAELRDLMVDLNHGKPVSDWAMKYVLNLADVPADAEQAIPAGDLREALAAWRCLSRHQDAIEAQFDEFDSDGMQQDCGSS